LLANVVASRGDPSRALELYGRARALRATHQGEEHPRVLDIEFNIALAREEEGALEEASHLQRALLERHEQLYGVDSRFASSSRLALARVELQLGHHESALSLTKRARAAIQRERPVQRSALLSANQLLHNAYMLTRRNEPALEILRETREMLEEDGAELELIHALFNEGEYLCLLGRCAEAGSAYQRALTMATLGGADAAQFVPFALSGLAKVEYARGSLTEPDYRDMHIDLERALSLAKSLPVQDDALKAEIESLLARTLHALGIQSARARGLASGALVVFDAESDPERGDEMRALLRELEGGASRAKIPHSR
jgi:tetratricopeptide (TPR) repeat protein